MEKSGTGRGPGMTAAVLRAAVTGLLALVPVWGGGVPVGAAPAATVLEESASDRRAARRAKKKPAAARPAARKSAARGEARKSAARGEARKSAAREARKAPVRPAPKPQIAEPAEPPPAPIPAPAPAPAPTAAPAPQARSWQAACGSGICVAETAEALPGEGTGYRLRLSRAVEPGSPWTIAFTSRGAVPPAGDANLGVGIDNGEPVELAPGSGYLGSRDAGTWFLTDERVLSRVFAALRSGRQLALSFRGEGGRAVAARFPLEGAMSVLLWIDRYQGRAGQPVGVGPPKDLPGAAANGLTRFIADPKRVPADVLAHHYATEECHELGLGAFKGLAVQAADLTPRERLYAVPCTSDPNNVFYRIYQHTEVSSPLVRQLFFAQFVEGRGWSATDRIANVELNAGAQTLNATLRGAAGGACGRAAAYRWTETGFQVVELKAWPDCNHGRPAKDWPVTFSAD